MQKREGITVLRSLHLECIENRRKINREGSETIFLFDKSGEREKWVPATRNKSDFQTR